MNLSDFKEYENDPDLWIDLCEINDIMIRFPFYAKCDSFAEATLLQEHFDKHFEETDLFMVCRQFDNFVFFESEEAKSLALLIK